MPHVEVILYTLDETHIGPTGYSLNLPPGLNTQHRVHKQARLSQANRATPCVTANVLHHACKSGRLVC